MNAIEIRNLSKSFRGMYAIDHLDMTVPQGAISGLSFELHGLNVGNLVCCMLAKIFLMLVFVPIFTLISVAAKQKAWLSICGSLGGGMLLFMMVSLITPLSSTFVNVALCAAGGALFAFGLGAISNVVLKKTSLV